MRSFDFEEKGGVVAIHRDTSVLCETLRYAFNHKERLFDLIVLFEILNFKAQWIIIMPYKLFCCHMISGISAFMP